MKNPLNKRFIRELKEELGKYIVLFLFITTMISVVSGFLVAGGSMKKAYNESFEKYNIEDGNFELADKATYDIIEKIQESEVIIYDNFYLEEETNLDTTMRIFINRKEVNKVCLMSGQFPQKADEIAIDRVHANNNNLKVGDILTIAERDLKITGLVALTDYSTLYQDPGDTMFDAIIFGVGVMTEEGFNSIGDSHIHYSYSWKYKNAPKDDIEAKEMADEFLNDLRQVAALEKFIPAYNNQAICFAGNDMGRDAMIFAMFLYLILGIIAFIFAITTSNTISKEATVIGTLRASGYSKGELIKHYMAMPMLVTLVAAVTGNVLGYMILEDFAADMYYNSYCLTTYEVIFNADAFISTTVIPLIIMFLINFVILVRKFKLSPLRFIRRDLNTNKKRKAFKLSGKLGIMKRFRLRIIFQNLPNYITIVIGIFLANVIMVFGLAFPALLENYGESIKDSMLCDYQYIVKMPVATENKQAECFTAYTLKTTETKGFVEEVTVYGVEKDSKYIDVTFKAGEVFISSAYADKYKVNIGDTITLKEEFEDTVYDFYVGGIYDYSIGIAVFMDREELNEFLNYEEEYFNGYFSNGEIDDLDERMVATVITEEDMTKLTRQLMNSMGNMMDLFFYLGIVIFMLVIYLLSKIIIEKNAQSISMIKIMGYSYGEINGLYVITTAIVVIVSLIITIPVVDYLMAYLVEVMFFMYSGWLPYYMPVKSLVMIVITGIVAYGIIAFVQMQKVRKIPMKNALKNVE